MTYQQWHHERGRTLPEYPPTVYEQHVQAQLTAWEVSRQSFETTLSCIAIEHREAQEAALRAVEAAAQQTERSLSYDERSLSYQERRAQMEERHRERQTKQLEVRRRQQREQEFESATRQIESEMYFAVREETICEVLRDASLGTHLEHVEWPAVMAAFGRWEAAHRANARWDAAHGVWHPFTFTAGVWDNVAPPPAVMPAAVQHAHEIAETAKRKAWWAAVPSRFDAPPAAIRAARVATIALLADAAPCAGAVAGASE